MKSNEISRLNQLLANRGGAGDGGGRQQNQEDTLSCDNQDDNQSSVGSSGEVEETSGQHKSNNTATNKGVSVRKGEGAIKELTELRVLYNETLAEARTV